MSALYRSRTIVSGVVAVLMFALAAPIAVYADDEALADEQLLVAQEQDPALAPAAPVIFPAQVSPDVRWAPGPAIGPVPEEVMRAVVAAALAWDETSGYGSVEASRAAASALLAEPGPAWLAASRAAAARRAAPAFPAWDAARWSPLAQCDATNPDPIPAQLASGQRAESAHLATVPLPGEECVG